MARILHFHDAPHLSGGASAYLSDLLANLEDRGHQSALFSVDGKAHDFLGNSYVFQYKWPDSYFSRRRDFHFCHPPLQAAIADAVASEGPDLIHIQNWATFRRTLIPCLKRIGIPIIMTVHDFSLTNPNPNQVERSGLLGPGQKLLDLISMKKAANEFRNAVDYFLCPSKALIQALGLPKEKAILHHLPVAKAPLSPQDHQKDLRLLFAGSLYPSKGVDILIRAMSQLEGVNLEIAGGGQEIDNLKNLCLTLRIQHRVKFLGPHDKTEMVAAYKRCNVLALTSRVPENSPLVVLEAGAHGRPSIAPQLGGAPEFVSSDRGWTFPACDQEALTRLLSSIMENPAQITSKGVKMREYVQANHQANQHWDELEAHYQRLLK